MSAESRKRRWFIGAIRTSLENQLEGGTADEDKPENFDIKSLLKGILVELEHTGNPLMAMEIAMDHLAEHPEYYDAHEIMEKALEEGGELEIDDDKDEDEDDSEEVEEVEDGAPAPTAISSVLVQIADHIDKSKQPSKGRVIASLKNVMTSIRRHPHFKTAAKECKDCGGKGRHYRWCIKVDESVAQCADCGTKDDKNHASWCPCG